MAFEQAALLLRKQLKGKPINNNERKMKHETNAHFNFIFTLLLDLTKCPVDGFSAGLVDENNIYEWDIMIIGPPETL